MIGNLDSTSTWYILIIPELTCNKALWETAERWHAEQCQRKLHMEHTLLHVGTALISFSIGDVSASGPFLTCRHVQGQVS